MRAATLFLDHLVGLWDLTGQMSATPLHQAVSAHWVLGGLFVEMHFRSLDNSNQGRKLYEALYHIGYHEKSDQYALHLLDTYGVSLVCSVGLGQRQGNSIPFIFEYPDGPFTNRFTWNPDKDTWEMEQTYLKDGLLQTFAIKHMTRRQA